MTWAGITDADLRAVSGDLVLHRGRELAADGAMRVEHLDGCSARAVAAGSTLIEVELEIGEHGMLLGDCTCPPAQDGSFCAHLVATAITCRDRAHRGDLPAPRIDGAASAPDTAQLRRFLRRQDPGWLVDQLLLAGERDPHLRARLQLAAGGRPGSDLDTAPLHAHLQHAFFIADFVPHREAGDHFARIDEALDLVEALIEEGHGDAAARLAREGLRLLEESSAAVEDPDGGTVRTLHRLEDIHLRACRAARPDPRELAATLLETALRCELGPFRDAPARYAEVLGAEGLARLAELVRQRRDRLPARDEEGTREERSVLEAFARSLEHGVASDAPPSGPRPRG